MMLVRPLADLAEEAGFSAADLAFLSGLSESTISRLWSDPDWLDRITGKSLQAIAPVMPGVLDYVRQISMDRRLHTLTAELADAGVVVDLQVIERLIDSGDAHPEHIGSALQAACHILHGDAEQTTRHLTRFWGRDQDQVLSHLFMDDPTGLVGDPARLIEAAAEIASVLQPSTNSFHAFMGYATIVHHTARSTGVDIASVAVKGDRQAAFLTRCTTIGLVLATNDFDAVDTYADEVNRSAIAGRIEDWSLPTYTRDAKPSGDFWLPRAATLQRTADEVLRELESYPEANTYYLAHVYLPRALAQDPRFGGRLAELFAGLKASHQAATEDRTQKSIEALVRTINSERPR